MFIDSQNLLSDAQAFTASAASTNIIDLGADRNIGIGEPMALVLTVDVAADGTTTDETYAFAIQTDTVEAFSSPTSIASATLTYTQLAAGAQFVIAVPPDTTSERFIRMYATLGGTTPTVTVTAFLLPMSMIQNNTVYADAITIS